jgi:hypothetical protein
MLHALLMVAMLQNLGSIEDLELEIAKRQVAKAPDGGLDARIAAMMESIHPEARAAVDDPSDLVAVLGTRRSGKSRSFIRKMLEVAAQVEHARVFYLNETIAECDRIVWTGNGRDGLITLNDHYRLGGYPNQTKHTLTFPRGGIIELVGADDMRQVNKVRGGAPHLVVIDEAQKMPHLQALIRSALGAGMLDHFGKTVMTGTPGEDLAGLFYEVTSDEWAAPAGWSRHFLNILANPFFGKTPEERYQRAVVAYCTKHGLSVDSPEVQRELFGKWVKEDARFTYAIHQVPTHRACYAPARWIDPPTWARDKNGKELFLEGGVPDFEAARADLPAAGERNGRIVSPEWQFTLFADLGFFPDPFAYVLWAWSWEWDETLEVASWAKWRLDSDDQLAVLDGVASAFPGVRVGGDIGGVATPIGKGWSKRWMERFQYGMIEAEKSRKYEHIQLFNTDLRKGRVRVREGSPYHVQLQRVRWLPRTATGALKEDPAIPNDITDAGLYGHRHTAAHLAKRKEMPPKVGSPEYIAKLEAEFEADDGDEEATSYYG